MSGKWKESEVGPGDIFYVGRGKKVKWTVEGTFRKVYTVYL